MGGFVASPGCMPGNRDSRAEEVALAAASYQYMIPRIRQRFAYRVQKRSVPQRMRGKDAVAAAKPQKVGVSWVLICFCDCQAVKLPRQPRFVRGVEVVQSSKRWLCKV